MKKIASKLMIGALSLAVFAPTAAFAATNTNVDETKVEQAFYQKQEYFSLEDRESNQQELMKIINKYNPDLADDFQKLFDQHEKVKVELDEATKKQLDEIREQVKNGTLTQEQANEKLGVKGFDLGKMEKVKFDEAKKQLDEIREQVKNGTLTQEQANEKLGVKDFDLGKMEKVKFDEAMVKKMDEINEQVKNGTLTQEQANEKLGVKDFGGKENIIEQIKVAADAGDADTVNKLLQEFLEKMQDKKQSIMAAE
ncbi:hypothetical protein [Brevibacillus laterosporus]|nr:hypothetical protein [Brevibacillus laterosporus]MED1671534.1 hypothetical protein [Brevibacillus laterosporus]MED1718186.1 hypothetical protein [Brevibacillus laterosporus]